MTAQQAIIHELEHALAHGTSERRVETLWSITDLFVLGTGRYTEDQVALFDDVFSRLVREIESSARAVLSRRLAPVPAAPPNILRVLAFDDEIEVAGPVLTHAEGLDEAALVANAKTKGQQHLLAISRRRVLNESVTDVLVQRGNDEVLQTTAGNKGAKFSELGFQGLILRAEDNDRLAACIGSRNDLPRHHFLQLLSRASQAVRVKLEAAQPEKAGQIQHVVGEIASQIQRTADVRNRDYAAAQKLVEALYASGRLDERDVEDFAKSRMFEETTVALSVLCSLPIDVVERAMVQDNPEPALILVKAAGFSWSVAHAILLLRAGESGVSTHEFERHAANFSKLKAATAQYVVRFQRMRANVEGQQEQPTSPRPVPR
jgi:uncharacterized protein (DUF2336 family)